MGKSKSSEWIEESNLLIIKGWARDGLTNKEIAQNVGVSQSTFYAWMEKFPEITEAIKKGREPVLIRVEDALYSRCAWRKVIETDTEEYTSARGTTSKKVITREKWIPPETALVIFALKNLAPNKWRDKPTAQAVENSEEFDKLIKAIGGSHDPE